MQARIEGHCAQFGFEYKDHLISTTINTQTNEFIVGVYKPGNDSTAYMLPDIPTAMQWIDMETAKV